MRLFWSGFEVVDYYGCINYVRKRTVAVSVLKAERGSECIRKSKTQKLAGPKRRLRAMSANRQELLVYEIADVVGYVDTILNVNELR
jgi:hypothetical protein